MLVIRHLFGTGTNCIAPSGLPLLLCLSPGLAPWAFLSRPCGASFATETKLYKRPATTPERDLRADLAPRAYPYRPREHVCPRPSSLTAMALYQRIVGDSWRELDAPVRLLHSTGALMRGAGSFNVRRGNRRAARLHCRAFQPVSCDAPEKAGSRLDQVELNNLSTL